MDRRPPGYPIRPAFGDLLTGVLLGPSIFLGLIAAGALRPGVGWVVMMLLCVAVTVASWLVNQQRALAAEWRRSRGD